ncbi:FG-GAP repeat domain-containing protein, partial [Crystallibacter degradans]|uniref:FG-GAP repeat domain-containing protein n=1 Tax=Crystallibacter degradans TaxID=2726743 RepID=UPI0014740824
GTHPGSGSVTVTAKAQTDYVLEAGAAAEWTHTFKATPYVVVPEPVVFTDEDGTGNDSYTVPETKGVDYLVGDEVVAAGTHPGSGSVTVTAKAQTDYVLEAGAAAEWTHTFEAKSYAVTPEPVAFVDVDGAESDSYTVPGVEGVEYLVNDEVVAAGTYPAAGSITVTARVLEGYFLAGGAATEWAHTFKATPYVVMPEPVVFTDADGADNDSYTVPVGEGVEYLVDGNVVAGGTYPASGAVKATARALADYVLSGEATVEWSHVFAAKSYEVSPVAVSFIEADGTEEDSYTIPAAEGVEYLVSGEVVAAGTYPASGSITVTARVVEDYFLAEDAATEWTHTFKATPYVVVPEPVVFTDADGTAEDTFTIPSVDGVAYVVAGETLEPGVHTASGTVTVTAIAKTDYALEVGADAAWSHTFKATPFMVVPGPVLFSDEDGTAGDTVTIPSVEGVEYLLDGEVMEPGTHAAAGAVTVTARAAADYVLSVDSETAWSHTFKETPYEATPEAVTFDDEAGQYTIPEVEGVRYYVGGVEKDAGTHAAPVGDLTVTAKPEADYVLAGTTSWSHTFEPKATPSIRSEGEIIAFDSYGRLWNYGHSGTGSTRVMIGRSGWTAMDEIHTVDWNSDGFIDIIAKGKNGQLYYYKAKSTGNFTRYTIGYSGWADYDLTVSKWKTTDKYPVVIAKNAKTGRLYVYGNNSGYRLSPRYVLGSRGWSEYVLTVMDWDKDGRKDVVAKTPAGQLKLYRGNGTGKFVSETRQIIGRSGWNTMSNIVTSNSYAGEGTTGLIARDSWGRIWYYQADKSRWAPRELIGTGWSSYYVAAQ